MKKIYLFLLMILCIQPAFAQEKVIYANKNNLRQELNALFDRADRAGRALNAAPAPASFSAPADRAALGLKRNVKQAYTSKANKEVMRGVERFVGKMEQQIKQQEERASAFPVRLPRKKWQVAFMMMDGFPKTALLRLQNKVEDGSVAQVSFLVLDGVKEQDSENMTLAAQLAATEGEKLQGTFYMIYASANGAVTESIRFEMPDEKEAVFKLLFKNLSLHSKEFFTALILFAHGDGADMVDGDNAFGYSIQEALDEVKEAGLHLDILDLASCHMGSVLTMYQLVRTNTADYLIASSDYAATGVFKRASRLLRFLDLRPKQAAMRSVTSNTMVPLPFVRVNELAYDVRALREPFLQWAEKYAAMIKHGPKGMHRELIDIEDYETYRLFDDFVKEQMEYVQTRLDGNDPVNKEFLDSSARLLLELKNAKLAQWCFVDSNCTKGLSYRNGHILSIWSEYGISWR